MSITANRTEEKINDLSKKDVYSMILFIIFKLKDTPEYSTLSELSYVLDNENLINLIDYFGGTTITIPTKAEVRVVVNALLIYQYVTVKHLSYNEALRTVNPESCTQVQKCYSKISEILTKYDFSRPGDLHEF